MTRKQAPGVLSLALAMGVSASAQQPLLQLQGQPYFGGAMTLHVTAPNAIGQPVLLAIGLDPLPRDTPADTSKGPFYIGNLTTVLAVGPIAGNGRLDLPFTMPTLIPGSVGIPIALQAYVSPQLSNPATLPLDIPYFLPTQARVLTSPNPQVKGEFGKYTTAGDLNGDGHIDLVIAAHKEDYLGVDMSGRVYIFWGPDFVSTTTLSPQAPVVAGFFGIGLVVADLDGIAPDDLIVAETAGSPAPPSNPAKLQIYHGAASFPTTPSRTILSPQTGLLLSSYGFGTVTGDFDDDGNTDIAVPHSKATVAGLPMAGRIDVYWGPDFAGNTEIIGPLPQAGNEFGVILAVADVNDDGVDDLVESSGSTPLPPWDDVGAAHIFVNPGFMLVKTIQCPEPLGNLTAFGAMLAVNDEALDWYPGLVLSDFKNRIFAFSSPLFTAYQVVQKPPPSQANPFGESVYGRHLAFGDINGDGLTDLLISDEFEGDEGCPISAGGRVFGLLAPYFATFHAIQDIAPACGDEFGSSILPLELDGDGGSELLIGVMFADDFGLVSSGHVTLLGFP